MALILKATFGPPLVFLYGGGSIETKRQCDTFYDVLCPLTPENEKGTKGTKGRRVRKGKNKSPHQRPTFCALL